MNSSRQLNVRKTSFNEINKGNQFPVAGKTRSTADVGACDLATV